MSAASQPATRVCSALRRLRDGVVTCTLALSAWVPISACSDSVHTVGQLENAPSAVVSPNGVRSNGSSSDGSSRGGSGASGGSTGVGTGTNASASGGDGASAPIGGGAAFPSVPFDAAVAEDPEVSCEGSAPDAVRERIDLYLMIDRNVTLAVPWAQITAGLARYVDHPEAVGTGVGVGYFPALDSSGQAMCDAGEYAQPDAPIDLLPDNAPAIKASFPSPMASLAGSPTRAALQGALDHAASRRNAFDVPQAVVLITDAVQDFVCFAEARDLETIAAAERSKATAVRTYVIALTVPELQSVLSLIGLAPFDNLDSVAASGGTGGAREVSLNLASGIADALAGALLEIQHDAEPCRYEVPDTLRMTLDGGTSELTTVLGTSAGAAQPIALPRVDGSTNCGQGYYLDDPAQPQWAVLCPQTCSAVKINKRRVRWLNECTR